MTHSDSDQQNEPSGIQLGGIHIGPIEFKFLRIAAYSIIGLFLWPYLLLLYIYLTIRRFNKDVLKIWKVVSDTPSE